MILTIAFGFVLRFIAGAIWGHDPLVMDNPVAGTHVAFGQVVLGADEIAVIVVTLLLTGLLFLFFARTKLGIAMQAASQNQLAAYYMGIPVKRIHGLTWMLAGAHRRRRRHPVRRQGVGGPKRRPPGHQGVCGGGHRRGSDHSRARCWAD